MTDTPEAGGELSEGHKLLEGEGLGDLADRQFENHKEPGKYMPLHEAVVQCDFIIPGIQKELEHANDKAELTADLLGKEKEEVDAVTVASNYLTDMEKKAQERRAQAALEPQEDFLK